MQSDKGYIRNTSYSNIRQLINNDVKSCNLNRTRVTKLQSIVEMLHYLHIRIYTYILHILYRVLYIWPVF